MVENEHFVYLFLGEDYLSKDITLKKLQSKFLAKQTENFNLDILYGKDSSLLNLQEKIIRLPFKSKKRIIVIKNAQELNKDAKEFVVNYAKNPDSSVILVLDMAKTNYKDEFINRILKYACVLRFKEDRRLDTFSLNRYIEAKKTSLALLVLNQLLKNGERPEMIIGALRALWEKYASGHTQVKQRIKALLECDREVKTGRLKAEFALEKLIIRLCCLS